MARMFAILLPLLFSLYIGTARGQDSYGRNFVVSCPEGPSNSTSYVLTVVAAMYGADFNVTVPLTGQTLGTHVGVLQGGTREYTLDTAYMLTGTSVLDKTIHISATADVAVYMVAKNSGDGYTAIPLTSMGTLYYIVTYCDNSNPCQFTVSAHDNVIQVEITLTIANSGTVTFGSVVYSSDDVISLTLNPFQTLQIRCDSDLTGTLVVTNRPVFVTVGGIVGNNTDLVLLLEQLLPVTAFGKEILTIPSKNLQSVGDDYRLLASNPDTTIQIGDVVRRHISRPGDWLNIRLTQPHLISSDKPIVVYRITQTGNADPVTERATMLLMIPTEQFVTIDGFRTLFPTIEGNSWTISVSRSPNDSVLLVDYAIQSDWTAIPGKDLYLKYTATQSEPNTVKLKVRGLVVYFQYHEVTYSASIIGAMNFLIVNPLCTPTSTSFGDIIDNDCDGLVDEDSCPEHGSPSDYIGKDCAQIVSGVLDSYSRRFIATFAETDTTEGSVSLVFSTFSSDPVTVNVTTPRNLSLLNTQITINGTGQVDSLHQLELSGSGVGDLGILIEASDEISVYTFVYKSDLFRTSGAARLLPIEALGREYYAVTVCESEECQIQIVAAHPDTRVEIKLMFQNTSFVLNYGGESYSHGDIISETLQQYQTWQLQSNAEDLTGSRVTANKPISVFSGGKLTTFIVEQSQDQFTEQLLPVSSWGETYATVLSPHSQCISLASRSCEDVVRIICSQGNTVVTIQTDSGTEYFTSSFPGDWKDYDLSDWVYIDSTKPISVIQLLTDGIYYDGEFSVLNPIIEYGQGDKIKVQSITGMNSYLIIITESKYKDTIQLNGVYLTSSSDFAGHMTYFERPLTLGETIVISSQNGSFGGYIYSDMISAAGYIFPLAAYQDRINNPCKVSIDTGGDGLDNDCDGRIDEETCNITLPATDDDLDGLVNEDCKEKLDLSSPVLSTMIDTSSVDVTSTSLLESMTSTFPSVAATEYSSDSQYITNSAIPTVSESTMTVDSSDMISVVNKESNIATSGLQTSSEITLSNSLPDITTVFDTSSMYVYTSDESECTCGCVTWSITTSLNSESLVEVTESIKTELIVDSREVSKTIRKLISAPDPRVSAQTVGYFGVAIISCIFVGIFILDAGALFADFRKLIHVLKEAKRG